MTLRLRVFTFFSLVAALFLGYVLILAIFIKTPEILGFPAFIVLPVIVAVKCTL